MKYRCLHDKEVIERFLRVAATYEGFMVHRKLLEVTNESNI